MRVICIANNKGGVAKTTTTINIAYGLAEKGKKVLVVDTDAQSNTTYSLFGSLDISPTLADLFFNGTEIRKIIVPTSKTNLHLVPSSINLSAADVMMASMPGREQKLKRALKDLFEYDFIIIDTPPNLGLMTINALVACTDVIIPIALTTYALIGINILEQTMQELINNLDIQLPVLGVACVLDDHTRMSANVLAAVKEHFGDKVFNTVIPRNIKVEESHNQIASIYDYAPQSTGAKAYKNLVDELLDRVG